MACKNNVERFESITIGNGKYRNYKHGRLRCRKKPKKGSKLMKYYPVHDVTLTEELYKTCTVDQRI